MNAQEEILPWCPSQAMEWLCLYQQGAMTRRREWSPSSLQPGACGPFCLFLGLLPGLSLHAPASWGPTRCSCQAERKEELISVSNLRMSSLLWPWPGLFHFFANPRSIARVLLSALYWCISPGFFFLRFFSVVSHLWPYSLTLSKPSKASLPARITMGTKRAAALALGRLTGTREDQQLGENWGYLIYRIWESLWPL